MTAAIFICFLLWLYFLSVFIRGKLRYFEFIVGSVGFFLFSMVIIQPYLLSSLRELVAAASGTLGRMLGIFHANESFHMLLIQPVNTIEAVYLYIDYECSGIIEMMAFVSMLLFFEVYTWPERFILSIGGCIAIFIFNVLRILTISSIVYFCGSDYFFIAHTLAGRVVFYALTIILYYIIFTKAQVIKQKIGGFSYAKHHTVTKE